jgi:hypothetical protein
MEADVSLAELLVWQAIGAAIGALLVGWRPWQRTQPLIYSAPIDPTPPTRAEIEP